MAKIQTGVAGSTFFNLNGLDYGKNQYQIVYNTVEQTGTNTPDLTKVHVGLFSKYTQSFIQQPILFSDWVNSSDTPYASVTALLTDLNTFVGFDTGGSPGVSPTGLEILDEGNGDGWRLIGRDPTFYGNIGLNCADFSVSTEVNSVAGATGIGTGIFGGEQPGEEPPATRHFDSSNYSLTAGQGNQNSGNTSLVIGQLNLNSSASSIVTGTAQNNSGTHSVLMGSSNTNNSSVGILLGQGNSNSGTGSQSFLLGINNSNSVQGGVLIGEGNTNTGQSSYTIGESNTNDAHQAVTMGTGLSGQSYQEINMGTFNTLYTAGSKVIPVATDRLFNIGNGTSTGTRSDVFTILKNGEGSLPGNFTTQGYTSTGTRVGGNLIVTIGDFDSSGNGVRLLLNDTNEQVEIFHDLVLAVGTSISMGTNNIQESGTDFSVDTDLNLNLGNGIGDFSTKFVFINGGLGSTEIDTSTAKTLGHNNGNSTLTLNNAAAVALTIPLFAVQAFPVGTQVWLINLGAGTVTIGGGGVTILNNIGGLTMATNDRRTLTKTATDTWIVGF